MVYRLGYGGPRYSIQTTEAFDQWFEWLGDRRARARIQVRIDRAEDGNFGDCEPVGEGVSVGSEVILLLTGEDKSTQSSDIKIALRLARRLGG